MPSPDKRADRTAQVRAQVDYHAKRLALYRNLHGSNPCARLSELERAYLGARDRMDVATPAVGAKVRPPLA